MRRLAPWIAAPLALLFTGNAIAASIPHDQVQALPADAESYMFKFQPLLKVEDGCVPFPAVDASGNTSGGLAPSGSRNGGCSSSVGQIYVRAQSHYGLCAVMYAWYFPKDQVLDGHRHDWESAVVWLSECSTSATVEAVSYSAHSGYDKSTSPPMSGDHPLARYYTNGFTNHQLGSTSSQGGQQPLIQWEKMPAAARNALTNTNFGSANVPMKDANFANNLVKADFR
ncbi:NPP1 family protein [Novosphingobium beihaiensis]|uniref:NPP1 family protein n=1 Tax=Novosphingobium beihaiensis TaxID=2930389 RepID=A0ABT0BPI0_9SPHN|nr:NPP1 family protein [Novosphingobium beihaiensis]MCJ2186964.1 NPP1 family protein [Novosphingobium beihaiensis]